MAAEEAGRKKLDSMLAKVAKEQSHSDVIALQSRLQAREVSLMMKGVCSWGCDQRVEDEQEGRCLCMF